MGKLRVIYPNLMKLEYDNTRTRRNSQTGLQDTAEDKTPMELAEELFEMQNNKLMGEAQKQYMESLMADIWEEKENI